ncbi:fimbrial protein [Yokenella regensburgei]|uniref:Fimbrial usher protein StbD n=1 Tax=Yokenella regensburgei TaxID=158877 RepID=A0AB38FXK3_9ENTR|nr:fimbrial protein [Yokenella regensburgei]KFD21838.1 putative exported protein [Yokenella regensburgei ATCC 49455]SQA64042.1 putative fimbrial usher protein StbD [Yokenella regensburgei]SQA66152.1 putative fimbrial usher protein StbD [Yokenella regensburgei]SUQ04771.1 putative fimbrial usher protein StbD [Yokenella regensburgei]
MKLAGLLLFIPLAGQAACEYIIYPWQSGSNSAIGSHRLSSDTDGIANNWRTGGGNDGWNGLLPGISKSIDLTSNQNFQPAGTILTSSGGIPFTTFAHKGGGYDPEQVFFRCTPDTAGQLFEAFSTNGDDAHAGWYEANDVPGAYLTKIKNIALRLTNDVTGSYFTDSWQQRPLENLDTDKDGNFLIKAKNFSTISVELIKTLDIRYYGVDAPANYNSFINPNAYMVFRGPGISSWDIKVGQPHRGGNWAGWASDWPSVISLYSNNIAVKRAAMCQVTDFTPLVQFPPISAAQLRQGEYATAPFQIGFACESNVISGVATNKSNVAMGLLAPDSSIASALRFGLTSGSAVSWLLDENYGATGKARGVGVRVYRDGTAINFLTTTVAGTGTAGGWMPVLGNSTQNTGSQNGVNYYNETFEARLASFGGEDVTAGSYQSHAQILLRIQ